MIVLLVSLDTNGEVTSNVMSYAWKIVISVVMMLLLVNNVLVKDTLMVITVKMLFVMVTVIGMITQSNVYVTTYKLIMSQKLEVKDVFVIILKKLCTIPNPYLHLLEVMVNSLVLNMIPHGMMTIIVLDLVLKEIAQKTVFVLLLVLNLIVLHGILIVIVNLG
jgi:hypothetical protein